MRLVLAGVADSSLFAAFGHGIRNALAYSGLLGINAGAGLMVVLFVLCCHDCIDNSAG